MASCVQFYQLQFCTRFLSIACLPNRFTYIKWPPSIVELLVEAVGSGLFVENTNLLLGTGQGPSVLTPVPWSLFLVTWRGVCVTKSLAQAAENLYSFRELRGTDMAASRRPAPRRASDAQAVSGLFRQFESISFVGILRTFWAFGQGSAELLCANSLGATNWLRKKCNLKEWNYSET